MPIHRTTTLALAAACAVAGRAHADFIFAELNGPTDYEFVVSHMPDLDQERHGSEAAGGLPNDGLFYCVPTALMNLLAYAANHGFPEQYPGPGSWKSTARYLEMSEHLRNAGSVMLTNPSSGTTHSHGAFGLALLLSTSDAFVVDHGAATSSWAPTLDTLAGQMSFGSIVAPCYGRYDVIESDDAAVLVGPRDGGHCTTAMHVARDGNALTLRVRDPASGGGNFTQSTYANRTMAARSMLALSSGPFFVRPSTAIDFTPGDAVVRLLDSYYAVRPKAVYDWEPSAPHRVRRRMAQTIDPLLPALRVQALQIPAGRTVEDVVVSADETWVAVISSAGHQWFAGWASLVDGAYVELGAHGIGTRIGVDRFGHVLVATSDERLVKYDRFVDPPLVAERALPEPARAMAYVDGRDEIALYAPSSRTLVFIDRHLPAQSRRVVLPAEVPSAAFGQIAIDPTDGRAWLQPGDGSVLYGIIEEEDGAIEWTTFEHESCPSIAGYDFDDAGHLFLSCDGSVHEFERDANGAWQPVADSPSGLDGQPVWSRIAISRSNTAWDPDTMSEDDWRDVPASEVVIAEEEADCPGDADADGVVGFADLLAVVSAWGACGACDADLDRDGLVTLADLLLVLAHWGPCAA